MKKILLTCLLVGATLGAKAYDLPYLVFQATDGTLTAVSAEGLTLTPAGGQLTATTSTTTTTFVLTNLAKMYFSADGTTAINSLLTTSNEAVEVYGINGVAYGKYQDLNTAITHLKAGTYVVKAGTNTQKIVVR